MEKKKLRKEMLFLRNKMSEQECLIKSHQITMRLLDTKEYAKADNILIYMHFGSEVKTHEIIEDAFYHHKHVFIPRIDGSVMDFYEIHSIHDCKKGFHDILEPLSKCRNFIDDSRNKTDSEKKSTLMILPGLAFDNRCQRLGYGGGYYDRYMANHFFNCTKFAVAYEMQICDVIPADDHDLPVDGIITEHQIMKRNRNT